LARELLEECGATLLNMDSALGAVIEHDFAEEKDYDIFTMTSYYYLCQIGDGFGQQKLDGYEQELGFMPVWIDIEKAISINRSLLNLEPPPE
jgi:hypothetical protein